MAGPPAGWLLPADVGAYLRLPDPVPDTDADLLVDVCAAAEPVVVRHRPDIGDVAAAIPPDIYQGSVMLAARLYRRRNSPAGIESMGEAVTYVASFDPDLDQFLRRGRYRMPGVG
jgi:hypothetical protein